MSQEKAISFSSSWMSARHSAYVAKNPEGSQKARKPAQVLHFNPFISVFFACLVSASPTNNFTFHLRKLRNMAGLFGFPVLHEMQDVQKDYPSSCLW